MFILEIFRELTSPTDPGRPPLIRGRLEAWNISSALGQEDLLATLPAHAEEMLGRRLEGLDPPEREFLELCALIGDEFDVSILDRLIEDEDALDRILDGLQGKGLIEPTSRTLERYRFAQPLLSAVVCGDVRERGPRRARRLHRRIAEAFEAIASREVPARLKIAHHWIEGAEPARGIPHLIAGLTWLMEHGLFRDARVQLAHWESASESATEIPEVRSAGFHLLRGRILVATGEYERALDAFRAAEREATERGDRHGWGRALMRIGEVLHRQGKPEEARVHFVRALEILGEIDDPRSLADAHTSFGVCCRAAGDVEQAEAHLAQALDLYRRCGDRRGESSTLINLANVHKTAGRHAEARACCLSALEIARELKNHLLEGTCHLSIGNSLLVQDEIEKALEEYGAVLEIYKRIGYKAGLGTILVNLAKAFAIRGDLGKAIHHAELSLRIAREVGRPSGEANSLVTLAELFTRIHRHDRAIEAAEAAGTIAASLGDAKGEAESLYIRGRCTAAGGDPSGARAFYERAAERGRAAGGGSLLAQIRLGEAELALREGSAEQALAIFREVRETTERLTLPALAAIATAGEGRCLAALGRIERAREALAAAVGRSADLPPTECERWAILFSHYEILTALGEDGAARALDEAHESLMRVASTLHDDDLRGAFLSEEICAAIVREARRG